MNPTRYEGPAALHCIHLPTNPGALCGALPVTSESLKHIPGLPVFPWVIPVCATVTVSLIVKRWHTLRSVKMPGKGVLL